MICLCIRGLGNTDVGISVLRDSLLLLTDSLSYILSSVGTKR